ncbi:MAG: hypothetical protein Q8P31_04045 [Bacillota bacterium]|nr:hypothetical protein [Bacillota bacterium]
MLPGDEAYSAARLVQWGLRPLARPVQEPEYRQLITAYHDDSSFRAAVHGVAEGLGLSVLDVSDHGIVLGADDDSAFALRPADFRPGQHSADMRLLDGLAQIAIATTVFPRARDLDEDPDLARPPVTVAEIEEQLRRICEQLGQQARREGDPMASDERRGLTEAWRVYLRHLAIVETKDNRQAARSTRRIIEYALTRLRDFGCFVQVAAPGDAAWQPTRRYQVMVQQFAATHLYELVQEALADPAGTPGSAVAGGGSGGGMDSALSGEGR